MTLHEFVKKSSYLKDIFEDMEHRIGERYKIAEKDERRENSSMIYNRLWSIKGYLRAAYDYEQISFEECLALDGELNSLVFGNELHR